MAKRSLKACSNGITKAKQAFERKGWTQEYLATEVGLSTRQSVWKFFSGRAIDRHIFMDLCFQDFRRLISQHRYQGQDWEFNYQQKQLLRQYYQAHQFLLECFEDNFKFKIEPNYLKSISSSDIN